MMLEILKPVSVLDADSTLAGVRALPSPGVSRSHNSSRSPLVISVLSILEASNISKPSVKPSPHLGRMCHQCIQCILYIIFGQMVKPHGRVQGADCPGNHLGFSPLSTSRVVRGVGARSGRELNQPHLRKLFVRHLFFLVIVNLVHLVAISLIEAGDRVTLKFFSGVRHLLKRQMSMKFMRIK